MSTAFSWELLLAILNIQYQGSGSPSTISPEPDYTDYTPLKKRRLANYREAEEEVRAASEKVYICTIYNSLFAPCAVFAVI